MGGFEGPWDGPWGYPPCRTPSAWSLTRVPGGLWGVRGSRTPVLDPKSWFLTILGGPKIDFGTSKIAKWFIYMSAHVFMGTFWMTGVVLGVSGNPWSWGNGPREGPDMDQGSVDPLWSVLDPQNGGF